MLEALRQITQQISRAADLNEALSVVVRSVKACLALDACSVYVLDESGEKCVLTATAGLDPRAIGSVRTVDREGLVGMVVRNQQAVSFASSQQPQRIRHFPEFGEQEYHSFLGVPILHFAKTIGVLSGQQMDDRVFSGPETDFLLTIAAELAGLISAASAQSAEGIPELSATQTIGVLNGLRGAPGVGVGLGVLPSPAADIDAVSERKADDIVAEERSFLRAVDLVREELRASGKRMAEQVSAEAHAMFRVYAALLDDDQLFADTIDRIRSGSWAPGALRETIAKHALVFEEMDDPYLRARAEDIRGLGRRVLLRLSIGQTEPSTYPERCVLVGDEISVARIADVPIGQLAGIVCARGSPFSHAAILARTLGIPAVMGVGAGPLDSLGQRVLLVDGHQGRVFIEPSQTVMDEFERVLTMERRLAVELEALRDQPAQTLDGERVVLQANAGLRSDLEPALNRGAEGVGLYRTEFAFMTCNSFPSEEEQFELYRSVLASIAPLPVTMRTLDVGGDKGLPYFPIREDNPFLGWRGIRVTLDNVGILLTQLKFRHTPPPAARDFPMASDDEGMNPTIRRSLT